MGTDILTLRQFYSRTKKIKNKNKSTHLGYQISDTHRQRILSPLCFVQTLYSSRVFNISSVPLLRPMITLLYPSKPEKEEDDCFCREFLQHGIPASRTISYPVYPLQPFTNFPRIFHHEWAQQLLQTALIPFLFIILLELFEPSCAHLGAPSFLEGWGHARTPSRFRYARSDDRERRAGTGCARTIRHPRTSARTEEEVVDGFRGVVARERETTGWIRQVKGVNGGAHATHGIFNIPLVGDEDTVNSQSRLVIWVTGLSPSLPLSLSRCRPWPSHELNGSGCFGLASGCRPCGIGGER